MNNPKILYISCHSILEFDELSLLTELGYDCFSLGAYTDPAGHYQLPRPGIPNMRIHPDLMEMSRNMAKTQLTWEFVEKFDIIIVMDGYSGADVIAGNWHLFKNKKVIWRTIGQSIPDVERRMKPYRDAGLKIVRYSPMEESIDGYIGADAMIRFYKDPDEFKDWTGNSDEVINFSQTLKGRRDFCGYDTLMSVGDRNPFKVYGNGNEDLGEINGGELSYDAMKQKMRDARVYLYGGTWPASYTLSFIEAMMTGIPMVCAGMDLWRAHARKDLSLYEVTSIIEKGVDGFWASNIDELRGYVAQLRDDHELAKRVGKKGREKAIELFGKETIAYHWMSFLSTL